MSPRQRESQISRGNPLREGFGGGGPTFPSPFGGRKTAPATLPPKKAVGGAFAGVLPTRLLDVVFDQARIQPWASASSFTKEQRQALVGALKGMPLTVKGTRPFSEAVVTRGGISVKEVKPSTLESKLVPGLYLAGEILDVDAFTGGFNLQIAWSTGALAGGSI